jgi:hypothetical protein
MNWRQRLFSNMTWRTALASFGERSGYSKEPGGFAPYFQYRVGPYNSDLYLYFPKEPFPLLYKNEIFNKLEEYTGYDIIKYLEFHYASYPDSQDFLRFLHYEVSERLKRKSKNARLLSALSWVTEKRDELQRKENRDLRSEIEQGVKEIVKGQPTATPEDIDHQVHTLTEKLEKHLERMFAETEKGIQDMTGKLVTGDLELNNHNHEEKLIQLLILLQEVKAPPQKAKAEQLFKSFSNTDIAAILYLHFPEFRANKINTIQRKVGDLAARLKGHQSNQAQVKKLSEALQDFFYP